MGSYIRSWLYGAPSQDEAIHQDIPAIVEDNDDDDTETIHGDDDDKPPAFPSFNSAQRANDGVPRILVDSGLMPPPPVPSLATRRPGVTSGSISLAVPSTTTKPPAKPSLRNKVALAPGHGPLDWANLKKAGADLRVCDAPMFVCMLSLRCEKGVDSILRVTPSMLKEHRTKDDAWSAINGKVYNITPYLPYHPGGEKELMRVAGRDGSKLFGALTLASDKTSSRINLSF